MLAVSHSNGGYLYLVQNKGNHYRNLLGKAGLTLAGAEMKGYEPRKKGLQMSLVALRPGGTSNQTAQSGQLRDQVLLGQAQDLCARPGCLPPTALPSPHGGRDEGEPTDVLKYGLVQRISFNRH
jgi:hypothetical protein